MIYDGNKEINAIYDGGKEVSIVYDGSKEVWSSNNVIYLGYGTSFNVKDVIKDYNLLTMNDFFIRLDSKTLLSASYSCGCWDGKSCNGCCEHFSDSISFTKTYNSITGEFKCNYGGHSVYVYIIPNSTKLINKGKIVNLGSGTSFTITAKDKASCTNKNFLYRSLPNKNSYYDCCSYNCPNSIGITHNYNPSTYILSAGVWASRLSSQSDNVNPYYIPTSMIKA